jgi:acyl carrier protein
MDSEAAVLESEARGTPLDRAEIVERVRRVVAVALIIDEEEVTPTSSIIADLGGESLDFLDIIFRLQKEFGVEFPQENLLERESQRRKAALGRPPDAPCDLVEEGVLTEAGLALLREKMPEADPKRIVPGLREDEIASLFTVQSFASAVEGLLRGEKL